MRSMLLNDVHNAEVASDADNVPDRLLQLRGAVFDYWIECVTAAVPEAKDLNEKIVTNALKAFYCDLVRSLGNDKPLPTQIPRNESSSAHGRERANTTGYGHRELLQELQLLRHAIFHVASIQQVVLAPCHRSVIARLIEEATLDAINEFSIAQKEAAETFIASLSHDLRNPLNVASVSVQILKLKSKDDAVTSLAGRIHEKLNDIDAMIQTLLDATIIKGRKKLRLQIAQVDLRTLAEEVSADMSSEHHPIVVLGESIAGYWCRNSLKRVLENLLSNAAKYGSPGTLVDVCISRIDETVVLAVHNEGDPIPSHERNLLFSAYHRFADISVKGWGLGLPFIRLVAESHGGTIFVESSETAGTTFKIVLPLDCRGT
jgi:signal transduction histidine kinase